MNAPVSETSTPKTKKRPSATKKTSKASEAPKTKSAAFEPEAEITAPNPDIAALVSNLIRALTLAQQAGRQIVEAERGQTQINHVALDVTRIGKTMLDVAANYIKDPGRVIASQLELWTGFASLAQTATRKLLGEPVAQELAPLKGDKRFRDPEWHDNPIFETFLQGYLLATKWLQTQVRETDGLDDATRQKADFYLRQIIDAIAPSNFILTNPEVLRATLATNGENLVRGMEHMLEDVERGHGKLRIQQTDMSAFKLGENIALTPGKVVFQNDLFQLIQYEPTTAQVHKRPLLIFPPWINKFYILDLTQEKSFVRWTVEQGFTTFIVSWVNPDAKLAMKSFEDYMYEGVYTALDAVEKATGEKEVNAIGYCIGGTMLATSLAHMAAKGDKRIKSATFFATQVDFTAAGDLSVFVDEEQIKEVEQKMEEAGGYLEGDVMARTFNMLRSNDLIWSYVVNNYLLGRDPVPFDLLYWNADATRMPSNLHLFYLRECYLRNNLSEKRMKVGGELLDLKKVEIPIFLQSSREDHIAPYPSVYKATNLFGGPVEFMLAGSGHIAGVINPPSANKYQYWTNHARPAKVEDWLKGATETPGSWWPTWEKWIRPQAGDLVHARKPGDGKLKIIESAPGSYVMVPSDE
jgi:polyhydroxyalkanoate synthase